MNLIEQAVRQQLRFNFNGTITVEQLFTFYRKPSSKAALKKYAAELQQELESYKGFDVFDDEAVKSNEQEATELRLALVKQLYTEIRDGEKIAAEKSVKEARRQELLALKAQKQTEAMQELTLEQIDEQLAAL